MGSYRNEFGNLVLRVHPLSEEEKLGKFDAAVKPQIRLEVSETGLKTSKQTIALHIRLVKLCLELDSLIREAPIYLGTVLHQWTRAMSRKFRSTVENPFVTTGIGKQCLF